MFGKDQNIFCLKKHSQNAYEGKTFSRKQLILLDRTVYADLKVFLHIEIFEKRM